MRKTNIVILLISLLAIGLTAAEPADNVAGNALTAEQKAALAAVDTRLAGVETIAAKIDDPDYKAEVARQIEDLKKSKLAIEKNFDAGRYEALMHSVISRYQVIALWLKAPPLRLTEHNALGQDAAINAEPARAQRGDFVLACDFETDDWWTAWGSRRQPVNTLLVEGDKAYGGRGRSLQVTTPRGEHMGTSFAYKFREHLGSEPDEIYFRYYLKFDSDWKHATSGGKLPGISGTYGKAGWGGRKVNGSDGWSARGLFETRNGADSSGIGFYCYHADMRGRYGENWRFQPRLEHGRWYCVEQYCKLNTPGDSGGRGKNDGILCGWIDGQVAFEKTDIRFRDVVSLKIEEVWVNVYHGGEMPVPNGDIHLYLDNLVIARQPIGPLQ